MAPDILRVPVANFVSETRAAKERDLFRRLPLIVAHRSELPSPGSFITRNVLGASLLIVRADDGVVASYFNMCRHRGGKVEFEASGTKRVFVCRYHGRAYERSGALRSVPYEQFFGAIDHSSNGLIAVATEERHGFIWVNLSKINQSGVANYLGPMADMRLASFGLETSTLFLDKTYTLDVNWKLVVDGACDLLHPPFLHPDTVGKYFSAIAGVWVEYGLHGENVSPKRKAVERLKAGESIEGTWKYFTTNFRIYPNSMLIRAPDHVEFWTVWPSNDSASKSTAHVRFLIDPATLDADMTKRLKLSAEILDDAALKEDFPMETAIQANSLSHPTETFVYGRLEVAGQHLHRQLRKDVGDAGDEATT
jgi:phenylpropionate dioxygenase-like ring-hydroxylating dioxygenase large terminal subunit